MNAEAFLLASATDLANPLATDATAGMRNDTRIEIKNSSLLRSQFERLLKSRQEEEEDDEDDGDGYVITVCCMDIIYDVSKFLHTVQ
jgi:hypothetical protein